MLRTRTWSTLFGRGGKDRGVMHRIFAEKRPRAFFYLSGVDEPDCHLLYDIAKDQSVLYVPRIDPNMVILNFPQSSSKTDPFLSRKLVIC